MASNERTRHQVVCIEPEEKEWNKFDMIVVVSAYMIEYEKNK